MPSAVKLRTDFSAAELRRLAKRSKDNNQSRRLLSLAAVLDGMNRTDAARIGGMDRQTLRDWVHWFNEAGPAGLSQLRDASGCASAYGRSALDQATLEWLVGLRGEQAMRCFAGICRRSPLERR